MLAAMETVTFEGRPATEADIWINGTYNGATVDIAVDTDFVGSMFIRVRFSATPRQVPITTHGEMKDQDGRVYRGRWHLFWTEP